MPDLDAFDLTPANQFPDEIGGEAAELGSLRDRDEVRSEIL